MSSAIHGHHPSSIRVLLSHKCTKSRVYSKTTAVSMFVAAFALAVPGSQTAIFSTGRRASSLLLQQIKSMMCQVLVNNHVV